VADPRSGPAQRARYTTSSDSTVELRQTRDDARAAFAQLGDVTAAITITAGADWDRLTLDERRALIRATVARVTVAPGRGAGRIAVEMV